MKMEKKGKGKEGKRKSEGKEEEKERKEKSDKKILAFLIVIIVILALVILVLVFKAQLTQYWHRLKGDIFNYHGMEFQKTMIGNITMYSTKLAIYRPTQNQTLYYTLYLRNHPSVLEPIHVNITSKLQRKVYISFEADPLECNTTILAAYKLGEFIDALGLEKEGAFANNEIANVSGYNGNEKIKNCSDAGQGTSVVLLKQSDQEYSYIHQEDYCYILEIADCKIVETSERFILALIDVMSPEQQEQLPKKLPENESNSSQSNSS